MSIESELTWDIDVEYHDQMIKTKRPLNHEEEALVLAFALFTIVYYGIDFTQ